MNAKELELKIAGLEKAIREHKDFSSTYENDLKQVQKQLEDYNKPELSKDIMEKIDLAIESAIMKFDFSNTENYEIEFDLDYNNTISATNIEFNYCEDLAETVSDSVMDLFKEKIEDETPNN